MLYVGSHYLYTDWKAEQVAKLYHTGRGLADGYSSQVIAIKAAFGTLMMNRMTRFYFDFCCELPKVA